MPDVDFIIDIGGQDIKCFKIRNGVIDNIFLNEACSSGCGSFLQTFANALGYSVEEFAQKGLLADAPVDLGSRCTGFYEFIKSSRRKRTARSIENISAGLSISVVKNALYKVIRATSASELGQQHRGTGWHLPQRCGSRGLLSRNWQCQVVRPSVAGLMGAYGAALYSMKNQSGHSTLLGPQALAGMVHEVKTAQCGLCNNHCKLTINSFRRRPPVYQRKPL